MALPGPHRIKGQRAFDFLYQHGKRHHGGWMVIRIAEARPALLKVLQKDQDSRSTAGRSRSTGVPGGRSGGHPRSNAADGSSSDWPSSDGRSSQGRSSDGRSSDGRSADGGSSEGRSSDGRSSESRSSQGFSPSWRCAVVISGKVSKRAVRRNKLRRLLHNHLLRTLPPSLPGRAPWLLISLKPGSADAPPASLLGECDQLLQQAGLRP